VAEFDGNEVLVGGQRFLAKADRREDAGAQIVHRWLLQDLRAVASKELGGVLGAQPQVHGFTGEAQCEPDGLVEPARADARTTLCVGVDQRAQEDASGADGVVQIGEEALDLIRV
jgi:hypothetical protein